MTLVAKGLIVVLNRGTVCPCVLFVCPSTAAQFALLTVAMSPLSTDSEYTAIGKVSGNDTDRNVSGDLPNGVE